MRQFLTLLGGLVLVILVVAALGIGGLVFRGRALDAESRAFVDDVVPGLAADWSEARLLALSAPALREDASAAGLHALSRSFAALGPLVRDEGAQGSANMAWTLGAGGAVSAAYVASAQFQSGTAVIRIALLKQDGRWLITGFHLDAALAGAGRAQLSAPYPPPFPAARRSRGFSARRPPRGAASSSTACSAATVSGRSRAIPWARRLASAVCSGLSPAVSTTTRGWESRASSASASASSQIRPKNSHT